MRSIIFTALTVAAACGSEPRPSTEAQPFLQARLDLLVSGPGAVVVSGAAHARCISSCTVNVARGSVVTLTGTARIGASFSGFGGACASVPSCTLQLQEDATASARFEWSPLPPVTGYRWARIDDGTGRSQFIALDDLGNAYGYRDAQVNENYPVRYDALTARIESLTGTARGETLAANDEGIVIIETAEGTFRWHDGSISKLDPDADVPTVPRDLSDEGWVVGYRIVNHLEQQYRPWVDDGTCVALWGDGETTAMATAVNNAGQVVGNTVVEERLADGTAWVQYAVQVRPDAIEVLPIHEPSSAEDLSDTGQVLGVMRTVGLPERSYLFDLATGQLTVFEPIEDDLSIRLEHLNRSGTLALGFGFTRSLRERPMVLFVGEGRLVDLNALVELPTNLEIRNLRAVNVHGQILASALVTDGSTEDVWADLLLTPE